MKLFSRVVAIVGLAALVSTATGCAADTGSAAKPVKTPVDTTSALVEEARAEGTVSWYATYDPSKMDAVAAAFTEKYGIKVENFRAPSAELIQRYSSERDAGKTVADVLSHSAIDAFTSSAKPDEFLTISELDLKSLKTWPSEGIVGKTAVLLNTQPFVIAYNTDRVAKSDVPKTWEAFFSKAKAGDIARPNWSASPIYVEFLQMLQDKYGDGLLEKIASSGAVQYAGAVPLSQAVAAGENSYGIAFPSFVYLLKDQGAPIDYFVPSATTGSPSFAAVPAEAPHPKAAQLLLDFLISKDGQAILNQKAGVSVLSGLEGTVKVGDGFVPVDSPKAAAGRERLLKLVGAQ